ncbi:MAG: hypothetical protein K2X61_08905 [Caulobacteraceae bacterium]|nr:hypothetical protein [Caulobacteraceae bacterium]
MTAGRDLVGGVPAAPRRRGRPPGSKNKRAADLKGWVEGVAGSTAAMQSAQLCLVTTRELAKAGGDHAKAVMAKAAGHVRAYEEAATALDGGLDARIRAIMADLVERAPGASSKALIQMVAQAVEGIRVNAGRFTLAQAVEAIAEERRALMPYTDQRQPQLVLAKGEGFAPVMVFQGGDASPEKAQQNQGDVIDVGFEVLQPKSHDGEEV